MGDELKSLRYSLTPPEIERYLWLGKMTLRAVETVLMEMKRGQTEAEIAGEMTRLLWKDGIGSSREVETEAPPQPIPNTTATTCMGRAMKCFT